MIESVEYLLNQASEAHIAEHLSHCEADFMPPLSTRVQISDYADKIKSKAMRFEAWSGGTLIGLVAIYCNDQKEHVAFITSVSVLKAWRSKGITARLMKNCIEHVTASGMKQIFLEVARNNALAIKLYERSGFVVEKTKAFVVTMSLQLKSGKENGQ